MGSFMQFDQRDRFTSLASFLKRTNNGTTLAAKSIEVMSESSEVVGFLLPFSELDLGDSETAVLLSRWREEHQYAYPTRFKVTAEGTSAWLENAVLNNANRSLFWVSDKKMRPIGHLGVLMKDDGTFEIDNVLRGETKSKGLMARAMVALEKYFEEECSIETITLRVLASNTRAVAFYENLGYTLQSQQPLGWSIDGEVRTLIPSEIADDEFLTYAKDLVSSREAPHKILTAGPSIGSEEKVYTSDAVLRGWNTSHSQYLTKFEEKFAEYVGSDYAMATSSCTGALHLSLLAMGVGPGDEVIVPEITWVATASAVRYVGATPIFCDVDPETWTITRELIENVITPNTKAIIPVHLYGFGAQMSEIKQLAETKGIYLIEDAAPAIGTLVDGKSAGTFGDFGCYSFQGAKMLVTGEGGMLVTNNENLYLRAKKLQDHGRKPGTFWIEELGYKYKMSNLTAALGLGQLERSEQQIFRKGRIRNWYEEELSNIPGLNFQKEDSNTRSIHWMTSITLPKDKWGQRDNIMNELSNLGIDTRPVFPAISQYEFWDQKQIAKKTALNIGQNSINLPSGVNLSRAAVSKIGEALRQILRA